jgi:hypothetical protein
MPAFQLLRCMITLGGEQPGTSVYRDRTRPIVFPELPILQQMHGEDAIDEVYVVGTWDATNDEVLARLRQIYQPEAIQALFHGARPRLPTGDPSIPNCTLPVYKPRSPRPDNPDPRLRPLDQFTVSAETPMVEAPPLPEEDEPTPEELAAHAQDDEDIGLALEREQDQAIPYAGDLPHVVRDTHNRGSSRRAGAARAPSTLPDVNAGGSHSPTYVDPRHATRG